MEWGLIFHPLVLVGGYMVIGLLVLFVLGVLHAAWERIFGGWPGNF